MKAAGACGTSTETLAAGGGVPPAHAPLRHMAAQWVVGAE
jgi:hypothetical protein